VFVKIYFVNNSKSFLVKNTAILNFPLMLWLAFNPDNSLADGNLVSRRQYNRAKELHIL
jgi:hypothetical protein